MSAEYISASLYFLVFISTLLEIQPPVKQGLNWIRFSLLLSLWYSTHLVSGHKPISSTSDTTMGAHEQKNESDPAFLSADKDSLSLQRTGRRCSQGGTCCWAGSIDKSPNLEKFLKRNYSWVSYLSLSIPRVFISLSPLDFRSIVVAVMLGQDML